VFDLRQPVASLLVLGAGPIGCEMAQAFARLGTDVTVVDLAPEILPREDADAAVVVRDVLAAEGVRFELGVNVGAARSGDHGVELELSRDGARWTRAASRLLVASGRTPNVDDLGLERAGVRIERGRPVLDAGLRTSNDRIYVIGDAAGGAQFTHLAEHHAGIVLRRALFHMRWSRPSPVLPWCTFTDPELARVGLSETEARARNVRHEVHRIATRELDRARTEDDMAGFAKLVTTPRGKLLGATIVAPHAGELIAEPALALAHGMKASDLSMVVHAYPTYAQNVKRAADARLKSALTRRAKSRLQWLFRLRGA
jgi:pyruvate/2-oxoglutarate dehydrogenase complex dihydrolipoamide dehydrogenase (E3) component